MSESLRERESEREGRREGGRGEGGREIHLCTLAQAHQVALVLRLHARQAHTQRKRVSLCSKPISMI